MDQIKAIILMYDDQDRVIASQKIMDVEANKAPDFLEMIGHHCATAIGGVSFSYLEPIFANLAIAIRNRYQV